MSQETLLTNTPLSREALTNQLFPLPKQVSGKEYSDNADKNTFGVPDPQQTLAWLGDGTTADGFDYPGGGQVDAMANSSDALFDSVINNQATLVFSTTFDNNIYYETPLGLAPAFPSIWANPKQIDLPGPKIDQGVHDVDALELWGPTDANRFSVYGDFKVAVWDYNSFTNTSTPLFYTEEIAKAIGLSEKYLPFLNVDGMMTSGDRIMFTIDPIEGAGLDGGEIWVWDRNSGDPAQFLKHGGHVWNTAFDVMGTFGTATENINALEAINYYGPLPIDPIDPIEIEPKFASAEVESVNSEIEPQKPQFLLTSEEIAPRVPSPKSIPGKEYSDNADKNTYGVPDPSQTLLWFGDGSTADGFDYPTGGQVDAMANSGDYLFDQVIENQATLVFSTTFDDKIYYEIPISTGLGSIWAKPEQIDLPGPKIDQGVHDVDALELWGAEGRPDSNRYSLYGDFGTAVWQYDPVTGTSSALFSTAEIGKAIGLDDRYWQFLNVDGMMTSGDRLMFTIDPIESAGLDGGEIWVWDRNSGTSAQFLKHGGHLWDTAFDVMGTFGTATENINALEAITFSSIVDIEPTLEPTDIVTSTFTPVGSATTIG